MVKSWCSDVQAKRHSAATGLRASGGASEPQCLVISGQTGQPDRWGPAVLCREQMPSSMGTTKLTLPGSRVAAEEDKMVSAASGTRRVGHFQVLGCHAKRQPGFCHTRRQSDWCFPMQDRRARLLGSKHLTSERWLPWNWSWAILAPLTHLSPLVSMGHLKEVTPPGVPKTWTKHENASANPSWHRSTAALAQLCSTKEAPSSGCLLSSLCWYE